MAKFVLLPSHVDQLRAFYDILQPLADEAGLSPETLIAVEIMLDHSPPCGVYIQSNGKWIREQLETPDDDLKDELAKLKTRMPIRMTRNDP